MANSSMTQIEQTIETIKEDRRRAWEAEGAPLAKIAETRQFTADEQRQWDKLDEDFKLRTGRIEQLERAAQQERAFAELPAGLRDGASRSSDRVLPTFSEYVEQRAMSGSSVGIQLGTAEVGRWIDRLRTRSVFLAAGPRSIDGIHGKLSFPLVTASVTVSARDQNGAISGSDPTLTQRSLEPVSFAALTYMSNEALHDTDGALLDIVTADLVRSTATALDYQFFQGTGPGEDPGDPYRITGITAVSGISNIAKTGNLDLMSILDAVTQLDGDGGNIDRAAYFVHPTDWAKVRKQLDTTNRPLLQPDVASGERPTIHGVPVFVSGNVPVKKSVIVDLEQVIVGWSDGVRVEYSEHAAFSSNQTAARITTRADVAVLNKAGVVTITTTT